MVSQALEAHFTGAKHGRVERVASRQQSERREQWVESGEPRSGSIRQSERRRKTAERERERTQRAEWRERRVHTAESERENHITASTVYSMPNSFNTWSMNSVVVLKKWIHLDFWYFSCNTFDVTRVKTTSASTRRSILFVM